MPKLDPITCRDDCHYHILAMQARTRMNLATCLVTSLHSLLSAERYLKDFKMPGWAPLNESVVKKQFEIYDKAGKKVPMISRSVSKWSNKAAEAAEKKRLHSTKSCNKMPLKTRPNTINKWTLPFKCNGRPWFVRWCQQEQLYLKSDAVDVVIQVLIIFDPFLFFVELVCSQNVGCAKSLSNCKDFPSDSSNINIFTWNQMRLM